MIKIDIIGITGKKYHGKDIDKDWNITPKEVMQFFGTQVMQFKIQELLPDININFFVKRFAKFYETTGNKNIVVADIRFQHEIDFIKENNGIIIKVVRSNENSFKYNDHISEQGIDELKGIDVLIENNSTKTDACNKLKNIINLYK